MEGQRTVNTSIGVHAGAPRQTILQQLLTEANDLLSMIDGRHDNIDMSLNRLLAPRPSAPQPGVPGILKGAQDRPSSIEGELVALRNRLQRTVTIVEELADKLQTAV